MDYPKFIVSNQKEESIGIQRVKPGHEILVFITLHREVVMAQTSLCKKSLNYLIHRVSKSPRPTEAGHACLTIYLIEMPFNTFASRADPDQTALDQGLLCLLMEI